MLFLALDADPKLLEVKVAVTTEKGSKQATKIYSPMAAAVSLGKKEVFYLLAAKGARLSDEEFSQIISDNKPNQFYVEIKRGFELLTDLKKLNNAKGNVKQYSELIDKHKIELSICFLLINGNDNISELWHNTSLGEKSVYANTQVAHLYGDLAVVFSVIEDRPKDLKAHFDNKDNFDNKFNNYMIKDINQVKTKAELEREAKEKELDEVKELRKIKFKDFCINKMQETLKLKIADENNRPLSDHEIFAYLNAALIALNERFIKFEKLDYNMSSPEREAVTLFVNQENYGQQEQFNELLYAVILQNSLEESKSEQFRIPNSSATAVPISPVNANQTNRYQPSVNIAPPNFEKTVSEEEQLRRVTENSLKFAVRNHSSMESGLTEDDEQLQIIRQQEEEEQLRQAIELSTKEAKERQKQTTKVGDEVTTTTNSSKEEQTQDKDETANSNLVNDTGHKPDEQTENLKDADTSATKSTKATSSRQEEHEHNLGLAQPIEGATTPQVEFKEEVVVSPKNQELNQLTREREEREKAKKKTEVEKAPVPPANPVLKALHDDKTRINNSKLKRNVAVIGGIFAVSLIFFFALSNPIGWGLAAIVGGGVGLVSGIGATAYLLSKDLKEQNLLNDDQIKNLENRNKQPEQDIDKAKVPNQFQNEERNRVKGSRDISS